MPGFTDIHCHMLSGTDDGARDDAVMFDMLEAAYVGGTRCICLTPHFNPMLFGDSFKNLNLILNTLIKFLNP